MNHAKTLYLIFFLLAVSICFDCTAQSRDSLNKRKIEKAVYKTLMLPRKECRNELLLSFIAIAIVFSSEGNVEDVTFSNLPLCSIKLKRVYEDSVKSRLSKSQLDKAEFSNKVVIMSVLACTIEQKVLTDSIYTKSYSKSFYEFDMKKFVGKEIKYFLTGYYYRFPSIE
jgi:hypothetical protein